MTLYHTATHQVTQIVLLDRFPQMIQTEIWKHLRLFTWLTIYITMQLYIYFTNINIFSNYYLSIWKNTFNPKIINTECFNKDESASKFIIYIWTMYIIVRILHFNLIMNMKFGCIRVRHWDKLSLNYYRRTGELYCLTEPNY